MTELTKGTPMLNATRLSRTLPRIATLALAAALLTGCVSTVPNYRTSAEMRNTAEKLRTTDDAEIHRRFGALADLPNKGWYSEGSMVDLMIDARWVVPGSVMSLVEANCKGPSCLIEYLVQYNSYLGRLEFINRANALMYTATVQADGSVAKTNAGDTLKWISNPSQATFTKVVTYFEIRHEYKALNREQLLTIYPYVKTAHSGLPEADFIPTVVASTSSSSSLSGKQSANATVSASAQPLTPKQATNKLTAGFPTISRGASVHGKIASSKDATPVLYVFDAKAGEKIDITATAPKFNPGLAIYRGADQQRIDAQAGQSPFTSTLNIKQTGTYLVAVYSADPGKGGDFTVAINMPPPTNGPSLTRPIAQK